MTLASQAGWVHYLNDPAATNEVILAQNPERMTKEALDYGVEKLRPLCLPAGMPETQLGTMTTARWQELIDQFTQLKLIEPARVKAEEAFIPVPASAETTSPAASDPQS
jgi:NitT/TauT family transport system substrate-binding protein